MAKITAKIIWRMTKFYHQTTDCTMMVFFLYLLSILKSISEAHKLIFSSIFLEKLSASESLSVFSTPAILIKVDRLKNYFIIKMHR